MSAISVASTAAAATITIVSHGNTGATETFDVSAGNFHTATLDANCTFTFTGATNNSLAILSLRLTQDATGSRTVTWPASVVWPQNTAPTLQTAAGAVDEYTFDSTDGGTTWYGHYDIGTAVTYKPGSTIQSVTKTSGNITLSASQTTHVEVSSALRLTLAATTGDLLLIGVNTMVTPGTGGEAILDSATIVSGSIVNQCSPGTKAVGHCYASAANTQATGTVTYAVQAGDISGGNVTVSLTYINSNASTGTLRAATDYGLRYWVINQGH